MVLRLRAGRWRGWRLDLRLELGWLGGRCHDWWRSHSVRRRGWKGFFGLENHWRFDLNVNVTRLRRRQGLDFGSGGKRLALG